VRWRPRSRRSCSRCSKTSASRSSRPTTTNTTQRAGVREKLFADGAPADFILIGATTREPDAVDAAIRSRCAAATSSRSRRPRSSASSPRRRSAWARAHEERPALIATYTNEGRKAVQILADAYGHALYQRETAKLRGAIVREDDVIAVVQAGRIGAHTSTRGRKKERDRPGARPRVAHYVGSIIEIEAAAFAAREARKGTVRFNDTAGSMSRDSVFNAASVVRALCGIDPSDFDLHVNVIGGATSTVRRPGSRSFSPLLGDHAAAASPGHRGHGRVSLAGNVRAVGGIVEKLYAARAAAMRAFVLPIENAREIEAAPDGSRSCRPYDRDVLVAYGLPVPAAPPARGRSVAR